MHRQGCSPNPHSFTFVFAASANRSSPIQSQMFVFISSNRVFNLKFFDFGYADALAVYKEMEKAGGVKPNEVKISSVLPACANLGALEVGEKIEVYARASGYFKNMFVFEFLSVLEPWNPGNYVVLSNIYARAGLWDGVARFRKLMKSSQITKAAGYSFIEEGGEIHKFVVEDKSHPKSNEIYALLKSPLD
ncbi:hypothetical protein T459_34448 [Capsicum annuum]|uniref:Pentatricopeptide repeat-containing protein n=1 Tax=Capsicum annuum TaxID=4072 RepID=A0A2G2XW30_CAPAN|nr:hypothetical protein T459_34448 [Capsicum annuum]